MIFNMQSGGVVPSQYLDEQTITPGTADLVISAETYLRGDLTIAGDADLIPENIKKGVNLFGITGTAETDTNGIKADKIDSNGCATEITIKGIGLPDKAFATTSSNSTSACGFLSLKVEKITLEELPYIGSHPFSYQKVKCYKVKNIKLDEANQSGCLFGYAFYNITSEKKVWIDADCTMPTGDFTKQPFYNSYLHSNGGGSIYCEAESKPDQWPSYWNYVNYSGTAPTTFWGVTEENFDAL